MQSLRITLRQLRRSPGFAVTAVLTLALGIGATTAIFTLVYDVLLQPLPFKHPEQIVTIHEKVAEWSNLYPTLPVSANHFTFWKHHNRSFKAIAAIDRYSTTLGIGDHPFQVGVLSATPGLFQVLQLEPEIGRPFGEAEAQPGSEHVALLLFDMWRNQFGSDPHIVGKTITLDGFPYTVIGVMPQSFHMPSTENVATFGDSKRPAPLGVIVPLAFSKDQLEEEMGDLDYFGLGRLNSGVSLASATSEMNDLQQMISSKLPANEKSTLSISLELFQEELVGKDRKALVILLAAVLGLLLVGCVNIANLLLARAVGQNQQIAIAAALGASRGELLKLSLRETVVLVAAGGPLGLVLAAMAVPAMQHYLPQSLDFRGRLHLDWAGAACAIFSCLTATLFAGAAPFFMVSRTALNAVLHSASRLASESRSTRRARRLLVGFEVAVSVALVLTTGLITISLMKLLNVHRGFTVGRTMTALIALPKQQYPDTGRCTVFFTEVLERLNKVPGLQHAAVTSVLPLTGDSWGDTARLPGDARPDTQRPIESFRWISPQYFSTIQLPLLSGRFFTPADWGRNVAVISSKTAKTLWSGRDPVGQQFKRGDPDEKPFTVVGVVADARTISLAKPDPMLIYVPYWFRCHSGAGLVVRTTENPASTAEAIRQTIRTVDPAVPPPPVRALGSILADSVANQRFEMQLLLFFAASALFLAGLGICGVVTYSVVQRQREIGLRFALGARRRHLYQLVLGDGLLPILLGTAAGLAIAYSVAQVVASELYDISPYDPWIAVASVVVLLSVGVAACLIPAKRAAEIDPMQALRAE